MKAKAVVALGNPDRGDDGVAHRVLSSLPSQEGAEFLASLKTGMDLALSLLDYEKALLIDADPSRAPGEVVLFPLHLEAAHRGRPHGLGLTEAFGFLKHAGFPIPEIWVLAIGVDPETPFTQGLSAKVEQAVIKAKEVAQKWLQS